MTPTITPPTSGKHNPKPIPTPTSDKPSTPTPTPTLPTPTHVSISLADFLLSTNNIMRKPIKVSFTLNVSYVFGCMWIVCIVCWIVHIYIVTI